MFTKLKEWLFGKPEQVQTVGNNSVGVQAKESVEIQVSGVPYKVEAPAPKPVEAPDAAPVEAPAQVTIATADGGVAAWPFDGKEEAAPKKPRKPRAKKPKAE